MEIMDGQTYYLAQEFNYLGSLERTLRDLHGIETVVYELIQNADDVKDEAGNPGTSTIEFDIRDDALVVVNDGRFRDVDFDRMRDLASGGKREEIGTTGAFGIGFISVYQLTDHPEILSSGQHWIIRPDAEHDRRIQGRAAPTEGTTFVLPWAFDPASEVRRRLRLEPIRLDQLGEFEIKIGRALWLASPFLKQLDSMQLRRNGDIVRSIEREVDERYIWVTERSKTTIWRVFRGNFGSEADRLKERYPTQIEAKRQSEVQVAVPTDGLEQGLLFAVLPSDTRHPFPFHINADFFPSSDRKRVILGDGYQSEWNRAAIRAAAKALAEGLGDLPELLGPCALWKLLRSLSDGKAAVTEKRGDPVFGAFWDQVAPLIPEKRLVYTSNNTYVRPSDGRFLESEDEEAISDLLNDLGIQIVHPDLRPYSNLLRSRAIGTPLVSVRDILDALAQVGIIEGLALTAAPGRLSDAKTWRALWRAFDAVLSRRTQTYQDRSAARAMLAASPIVWDDAGDLRCPENVYTGDAATRELFTRVIWLDPVISDTDGMPAGLVQSFDVGDALAYFEKWSPEKVTQVWKEDQLDIRALYEWFEKRRETVLGSPGLRNRLRDLPIWPVGEVLASLHDLYIPGGFQDPFGISELLSIGELGGRRDFLLDLGVRELDFTVYVRDLVPRVLQTEDVPAARYRMLVRILSRRLGEIRDQNDIRDMLLSFPLIECDDGRFRTPAATYLPTDLASILGDRVNFADISDPDSAALVELYRWFGVAAEPRPADIIARVEELVAARPNITTVASVQAVFGYLVERWEQWPEETRNRFSKLKHLSWLPSAEDREHWQRPKDIYAIFQRYLFETQASFLAVSLQLQQRAGRADLLGFLGIPDAPPVNLVVRHLLQCSLDGVEVNRQVYTFLSQNAGDRSIHLLREEACLLLPEGKYVRPTQVFWGAHPFGPFRYQLAVSFRQYGELLEQLGVREAPEPDDYMAVLQEISAEYGHRVLDEEAIAVAMRCWESLTDLLTSGRLGHSAFDSLRAQEVIPNDQGVLYRPDRIFFEDRTGLKEKLGLDHNVISRPVGAWRSMAAAGVRLLGQAVEVSLTESPDAGKDEFLAGRFSNRLNLVRRVIESERVAGAEGLATDALASIRFERAQTLQVQYGLRIEYRYLRSEPEMVPVQWMHNEQTLLVRHANGDVPWPAVARELAYAIKPLGEIGGLASGLKEALSHDTYDQAVRTLNDLGYPEFDFVEYDIQGSVAVIEDFGGEDIPPEADVGSPVSRWPKPAPEMPKVPLDQPPEDIGDNDSLATPEESLIQAILGDQGDDRSDLPDQSSEYPEGHGTRGGTEIPRDKPTEVVKPTRRKTSRLVSYVYPDDAVLETDPRRDGGDHRAIVERAGVDHVLAYERACGREPEEMDHFNPGFDVKSSDELGSLRYIEVKALSAVWDSQNPAQMTRNEFEMARTRGHAYWLYIVERATSEDAQLHVIRDPANRATRYLIDHGWLPLDQIETIVSTSPSIDSDAVS